MKKLAGLLPFFFVLVFILSCSKEVKRPSEDAVLTDEALKLADSIRVAYADKDIGFLGNHFSPAMLSEIDRNLKGFEHVELTFTPAWVDMEGDTVRLRMAWSGKWKADGKVKEERGTVLLEFRGRPLRLDSVSMENPFLHR